MGEPNGGDHGCTHHQPMIVGAPAPQHKGTGPSPGRCSRGSRRPGHLWPGRAPNTINRCLNHKIFSMKKIKAIYPGSFDPPTNGHFDLIERGAKIFDELVVAVLRNREKEPFFSVEERMEMLQAITKHIPNVHVDSFDGLLVDYVQQKGAQAVLRGIRAISDYEYELQMAL